MKTYVKYSLIAWLLLSALVMVVLYTVSDLTSSAARAASFIVPQVTLFYVNLLWLSCTFLQSNKKRTYFGLIILLVIAHVTLFVPLDIYLDELFPLDLPHFKERPQHMIIIGRFMASIPPLVVSALIWKSLQLRRQVEESLELKNKMLQAETKALKAQINPHFLFNSMNNIYSLSQMKSNKTGDAILNLSEILRFVTYESEKDRVSVNEELKQINNFIQLQLLKDDENENVHVEIENNLSNNQIAPMLLLPFIENSFKHSNFENKATGWIDIKIKVGENRLVMALSNSADLSAGKKDGLGGVGMENVKKRLALIYPEKHTLTIKQDEKTYKVELDLDLSI